MPRANSYIAYPEKWGTSIELLQSIQMFDITQNIATEQLENLGHAMIFRFSEDVNDVVRASPLPVFDI